MLKVMKVLNKLSYISFISLFVFAFCLPSFGSWVSFEGPHIGKIIGEDNFIPVNSEASNIPLPYQALVEAFGKTNYLCTVTHIGNGYVLSAGHCFDATETLQQDRSCRFVRVDWGYRNGKNPSMKSQCESIVAMQKYQDLDFAILKVTPYPKAAIALNLEEPIYPNSPISIFSHPDGSPLKWSQECLIESQVHPPIPAELLQYSCDTSGGSSGAALIEATTLRIVGIHKGGEVNMNYGTHLLKSPLIDILRKLKLNPVIDAK